MSSQQVDHQKHSSFMLFLPLVFLCLMFEIFRLPEVIAPYRPNLLALVLIYFSVFDPRRINIEIAWICGLLIDLMTGAPLGINALSYALQIYLIVSQFKRFAIFAKWQQLIIIVLVNFLGQVLCFWIGHIMGQTVYEVNFAARTVTTGILWIPTAFICALLCSSFSITPSQDRRDQ